MLQQKQNRVRISSKEKVINMSEEYLPSDSKCSCHTCDSIACFKIRNINSGIPCTCTGCVPNRCLSWETTNNQSKSADETKSVKVTPEILKDLLNISDTKLNDSNKNIERPINTTNKTKKEKICFSYIDNDLQKEIIDDPELKEVFTIEKNHVGKCSTMKKLLSNENIDDPDIKDTSSNEKSDIIDYDAKHLERNQSSGSKHIALRIESDTKKCCKRYPSLEDEKCCKHKTKQTLLSNESNEKNFTSKSYMPLRCNSSAQPETKELFTRKIKKCCSQKISTNNIKSDLPEVYQIFTNERNNVVKCCILSKDAEDKFSDASKNKQDNPNNKTKCCKEKKDLQNKKVPEPSLEIKTTSKITKLKCNHEHPVKDKTSDRDFGNYTKYTYKDVSHTKNKMNINKNIKSYEKYVSRLQSVAISYAREDYDNSRAELSAQIMNVPYEEFKDSLSRKQSSIESNTYNNSMKLDKLDIFSRLKEIYKACSCKVCECIAGKSLFTRTETCNCRPCDCDDCNGYMAKLRQRIANVPNSGCPCVRCDRKDCRGVVKSTSDFTACDCEPCDCVRRAESFTKPCNCTPCQCEICKTSIFMPQALLIANAAESLRPSTCDCEPCECTNCISSYSAMTSNLMREVSTGMISHNNCNCENCSNDTCELGGSECKCNSQHKVIQKPIREKRSDYGIHRVYIKENKYEKKSISNKNRNTIAMLALSNNYPNGLFNYSNKKDICECDVCECIVCKDKGKGSIINKSLKIEMNKQNCSFKNNSLNNCEYSPCACPSCKNLRGENVNGKFVVKTGFNTCSCSSSKYLGDNKNNVNNNGNYAKNVEQTYSENNCMCKLHNCSECKNLVNLHSKNSTETNEGLHDDEKIYLLKKGKLLGPSMFENDELISKSSYLLHKPEKDSLMRNDLQKKVYTKDQNTKLYPSESHHYNLDSKYNQENENTYKIKPLESLTKLISTNSLLKNMVSKEVGSREIYTTNSIDFKNGNVSNIYSEHSKLIKSKESYTIFHDAALMQMAEKPSPNCLSKKIKYKKDIIQSNQTPLIDRNVEDFLYQPMSSSINDVHFSSAKSMSLVKLLCKERNLNIDKKSASKFLQSIEKIPLKSLKMGEKNVSHTCDKTLYDDIFFGSFDKDHNSYPINNHLFNDIDQEKLENRNCKHTKLKTDLTNKKIDYDNYDILNENTVKPPEPKTIKQIKPKVMSNLQMFERKPNYNYNTKAAEGAPQCKSNKPRSKAKLNSNSRSKIENNLKGNKVNNKRLLEVPDVVDTASSSIKFVESDKRIDFERSFKFLREVAFNNGENKRPSPILRKNLFIEPEIRKNKGMCTIPLLQLDVKNTAKSISLQTNIIYPYCGIGFGNEALTKPQTEVSDLHYSPLLQSSAKCIQTEKSPLKSKINLESKSTMSDATSQTRRKNIFVDKEMNCNILEYQSRENLKQSIQNLIKMTLKNVVDDTDMETRKLNLMRNFNELSTLNVAKSSCDGLRASFVGLRKVSDHSVLLRWAMPRDLTHIQGYEVDGRPVQKIFNPSRCMAVLTCLPHCDKLLLTIRTITNLETCHNPVTTVVYNPKKNRSGLQ